MKLKALCLFLFVVGAGLSGLDQRPAYSHQPAVNSDQERQACHIFWVRAKQANRELRSGKISAGQRRSRWLKYRDCLGGKDKNYLLPAEFKYK